MTPESPPKILRPVFDGPMASAAVSDAAHDEQQSLRRLSRLHGEAIETAHLANLLGRAPYTAWLLIIGVVIVALSGAGASFATPLLLWCVFTLAAAIALLRIYRRTIVASFELLPLRAFMADLKVLLLYAGVAWGSGALLALPPESGALALVLFSAGAAAAAGAMLRERAVSLYFLGPAVFFPAAAALLRPLPDSLAAAGLVVVAGLAVAAMVEFAGRWRAWRGEAASLSPVTIS